MGVSGSGKSTLARALAGRLGWAFLEGDDCHPEENRRLMAAGIALEDHHRAPFVDELCRRVRACPDPLLLAFSGLRRVHRQRLRGVRRNVMFMSLQLPKDLLEHRLQQRIGHFMPPALLGSQLAAFESTEGEAQTVTLDGTASIPDLLDEATNVLRRWPALQEVLA